MSPEPLSTSPEPHGQAAAARNERRLVALVDLAEHLAAAMDEKGVLRVVAQEVSDAAGCCAAVMVTGGPHPEFLVVEGHDPSGFPRELPDEYRRAGSFAGSALEEGRLTTVPTAADLVGRFPMLAEYQRRSGHQAWAAIPVPSVGALLLAWDEPQRFSEAQRAFLSTLGSLIGSAFARAEAVSRTELERFVRAFDAMLDGVAIHRAVRGASGAIVDLEIEYLNPVSQALPMMGSQAPAVGGRYRTLWPTSSLFERYVTVIATGTPFVLEDTDSGALGLRPGTTLSIRASRLDPDRIVVVIRDVSERVALTRQLQESNQLFAVAQELAHVGSWRYELATGSLEASDELYRIAGLEPGTWLPRPGEGLSAFEHPDDRGVVEKAIGQAIDARAPFTFDLRIVRRNDGQVRETTTSGTVMIGPRGEVTGIWGATQDITERRRALASRHAALDALARQRLVASELQAIFLPEPKPDVPGLVVSAHYRPSTGEEVVGGDWFDGFVGPDGRCFLAVGDVAGRGIGCAALAIRLRMTMRTRANDGRTTSEILQLAEAELDEEEFATCWLGAYDPPTRNLHVANAGHLPAALLRGGACRLVAPRTRPPLGVRADAGEHVSITLQPGDVLVAYTDGLVERRDQPIDVGIARLCRELQEMGDVESIGAFLAETLAPTSDDDLCVLVARVVD